jgi:uncharacterized protein (DUF983 family)
MLSLLKLIALLLILTFILTHPWVLLIVLVPLALLGTLLIVAPKGVVVGYLLGRFTK